MISGAAAKRIYLLVQRCYSCVRGLAKGQTPSDQHTPCLGCFGVPLLVNKRPRHSLAGVISVNVGVASWVGWCN